MKTPKTLPLIFAIAAALFACMASPAAAQAQEDPREQILSRYARILEMEHRPALEKAKGLAGDIGSDGKWPDLDYVTPIKGDWGPLTHMNRAAILAGAIAFDAKDGAEAEPLRRALEAAVAHAAAARYKSTNWHHNEIGIPGAARNIAILLRKSLPESTLQQLISLMAQHNIDGTGANLTWSAELAFHYGCLTGDLALIKKASDLIWNEIKVGGHEGIQSDWSFFQHDARLYPWGYGKAYLGVITTVAWQLRGTPWAIPEDKRTIIDQYILEGAQWMARGVFNSPAGVDRGVSRPRSLRAADIRGDLRLWMEISPAIRPQLQAIIDRQSGQGEPLEGFRYYPVADFAVYHTASASIMLKTLSDRTELAEVLNGDNLAGWPYLACGDHYVISNGREYDDLQPVWDWTRLPGLTIPALQSAQVRKSFVGGLGDGYSGAAVMDYARAGDSRYVELRKLWAFHDGMMVCLLGGFNMSDDWAQVYTSIEQCRVQGDVLYSLGGQVQKLEGGLALQDVRWVLHNGVGYVPLNPKELRMEIGERTGSWRNNNRDESPRAIKDTVLQIVLEHGFASPPASGYIVVLDATPERLDALLAEMPVIARNNADAQVVEFADGTHMGAFYRAHDLYAPWQRGTIIDPVSVPVRVTRPCVAMWTDSFFMAADPEQNGGQLGVRWGPRTNRREMILSLPADGQATVHGDSSGGRIR